jgi:hypothetical protein
MNARYIQPNYIKKEKNENISLSTNKATLGTEIDEE